MSGGKWYPTQHVSANGRIEWPEGPLDAPDPGFSPVWLESWIVQGGGLAAGQVSTGPSQSSKQSLWSGFAPLEWTATEPGWVQGQFTPGTVTNPQFAMGIALLALQNNTGPAPAYKYVWWFELVFLQ